ncbi:dipeptide ABC transporter ATP-binding protein [Mycolicibacterium mengxianglii]|uniref:dipeptide ABC transporter ATP-binding protein n=1 Tax=Mycolicibacterium mengxianglii TaxID=2736649 RepID=UPI0018D023A1|nr:ABC transporter ATP-binding protein [Mycolicibacterium mengxianglii]
MSAPVLSVADLRVGVGRREIVRGISFEVHREQTLGLVGESGSGKSMTVLAATGLLDTPGAVVDGSSLLAGDPAEIQLVGASSRVLRHVHGARIGFVFQDPGTSLNPLLTLERQITESLEAHRNQTRRAAKERALELLEAVGLPDPQRRLNSYPHQLSGGQRQRVMIAIALACDPELLIADEPTTALDVTTQAQIIELVRALQRDFGTAVVWISHDLGVIGQVADDVTVLRDGTAVEQAPVLDVFDRPRSEYTRELLTARPMIGGEGPPPADPDAPVLLRVDDLDVQFPIQTPTGKSTVHAVQHISFDIPRGSTLGLVGESGSGKSTVAAALTGQIAPDSGTATLDGVDIFGASGSSGKVLRRKISLVFQDPFSSLNPRLRVGSAIAEPLLVHKLASDKQSRAKRVAELLELVGLPEDFATRYPHELSGGQRQRVSIARALATEPELLILDESTASLDVSVQARVLDLLARLQSELGLTYLFIAHDLAVVQRMCHQVLVLRNGVTVEYRPATELFAAPEDDYTRALLKAVPPARPRASAQLPAPDPAASPGAWAGS